MILSILLFIRMRKIVVLRLLFINILLLIAFLIIPIGYVRLFQLFYELSGNVLQSLCLEFITSILIITLVVIIILKQNRVKLESGASPS